jgi:hypothetical protein
VLLSVSRLGWQALLNFNLPEGDNRVSHPASYFEIYPLTIASSETCLYAFFNLLTCRNILSEDTPSNRGTGLPHQGSLRCVTRMHENAHLGPLDGALNATFAVSSLAIVVRNHGWPLRWWYSHVQICSCEELTFPLRSGIERTVVVCPLPHTNIRNVDFF